MPLLSKTPGSSRCASFQASSAFDTSGAAPETYRYYARWQRAFERLLAAKGVCAESELDARARALAARPPGHDHGHEHEHEHEHD